MSQDVNQDVVHWGHKCVKVWVAQVNLINCVMGGWVNNSHNYLQGDDLGRGTLSSLTHVINHLQPVYSQIKLQLNWLFRVITHYVPIRKSFNCYQNKLKFLSIYSKLHYSVLYVILAIYTLINHITASCLIICRTSFCCQNRSDSSGYWHGTFWDVLCCLASEHWLQIL